MPTPNDWREGYLAACFERDLEALFETVEALPMTADRFYHLQTGLEKIMRSYREIDEKGRG